MRPAPNEQRFSPFVVIGVWVAALFASALIGAAIAALAGYGDTSSQEWPLWLLAVAQVPLWASLLVGTVLVSRRQGTGDLRRDYGLVVRPIDAAIGLPVGVLAQLVGVWLVYQPLFWIFGEFDVSGEAKKITDRGTGLGIVLLVLIVVIGAPIVEELFFRGLLLRSLEGRIANGLALVVSSVLFGAAHLQPIQFPALVFIGLVLGWLAQRFGRLGPSMFAHLGFNLVTVIVLVTQR